MSLIDPTDFRDKREQVIEAYSFLRLMQLLKRKELTRREEEKYRKYRTIENYISCEWLDFATQHIIEPWRGAEFYIALRGGLELQKSINFPGADVFGGYWWQRTDYARALVQVKYSWRRGNRRYKFRVGRKNGGKGEINYDVLACVGHLELDTEDNSGLGPVRPNSFNPLSSPIWIIPATDLRNFDVNEIYITKPNHAARISAGRPRLGKYDKYLVSDHTQIADRISRAVHGKEVVVLADGQMSLFDELDD